MTGKTVVSDLSDLLRILDPDREFPELAISKWLADYYEANHCFPCSPPFEHGDDQYFLALTCICQSNGINLDLHLPTPQDLRQLSGMLHFRVRGKFLVISEDEHGNQTSGRGLHP